MAKAKKTKAANARKLTIHGLARRCWIANKAAKDDKQQRASAVALFVDLVTNDVKIRLALLNDIIKRQANCEMNMILGKYRQEMLNRSPDNDGADFVPDRAQRQTIRPVTGLLSGLRYNLMEWPVDFIKKPLGSATPEELLYACGRMRQVVDDYTAKANWIEEVAKHGKPGKKIRDTVNMDIIEKTCAVTGALKVIGKKP